MEQDPRPARDVYETWRSTLAGSGREARILAWAPTTSNGFCIGSPSALSHGTAERLEHVGWHQIEHGGWNAETRQLSWTVYYDEAASRRGAVELIESGRLPELFRERVAATIVVGAVRTVRSRPAPRGVIISARRDLAGRADAIAWHATLSRGLAWQTEGVPRASRPGARPAPNRVRHPLRAGMVRSRATCSPL